MSRYQPYPEYKYSGVKWIGEVPAHWEIKRLKNSIASCRNGIWGDDPVGNQTDTPCVRVADFDRQNLVVRLKQPTLRSLSEVEKKDRLLLKGDLILEKSGGGEKQPVGAVMLYDHGTEAVCSNFTARVSLKKGMNSSFWRYVHAAGYANQLNIPSIKQTSGIQNLDQRSYLDELAPLPDTGEQNQIASFLDRETTRLDTLIEKKERFIELLQEKRQALITQAVTKGLDLDVPMKDSGVEWIGEVPAHWGLIKLRHHAGFLNSNVDKNSHDGEVPVRLCNYTDVYYNEFVDGEGEYMRATASQDEIDRFRLQVNDIVITKDSEDPQDIAIPALITKSEDHFVCGYHLTIIRSGEKAAQRFLHRLFDSQAARAYFFQECPGVTRFGLNQNAIGAFTYGLPPTAEMRQIANFLDRETTRFDKLVDTTRQSIDLLKERRSSLITAAVTGKIDVRGEAA